MADPHSQTVARVLNWKNLAVAAAAKYQVDPAYVLGIIHQESGGDPEAYRQEPRIGDASWGLMQLLLSTARGMGYSGPPRMLFDPVLNIDLGTHDFAGGVHDYGNPWLALIDYNGGPGAVRWYRLGWKRGPAVHYANVVWALSDEYRRRLKALAAVPNPA